MKKTIVELIDELITVNTKIFMLVDEVNNNDHTKESAKRLQDLNMYRSQLKNAMSEYFNERQEVKI